jgi:hypothetical protein
LTDVEYNIKLNRNCGCCIFTVASLCLIGGILICVCLYALQEVESEDEDLDDEVDDGAVDEPEHEVDDTSAEPAGKKAAVPVAPPKDTERQLSKKELKKKELAELDAVLAELGISGGSSNAAQDENNGKCYCIPCLFSLLSL